MLESDTYLVRTQAGFKKATRMYFKTICGVRKYDISNYPKKYPAVCVFSFEYRGSYFPTISIMHLKKYKANLNRILSLIDDSEDLNK